jgi:hypothetical protein
VRIKKENTMSERYAAYISIGGQVEQSRLPKLLEAISKASVSLDWSERQFEPQSVEDLLTAVRDGSLWLCDDQSRYGTFPELEATCRKLGLSYSRWCEGYCQYDAEVVDWEPGMRKPLVRVGSNAGDETYVPTESVREGPSTPRSRPRRQGKGPPALTVPEHRETATFQDRLTGNHHSRTR